MSVKVNLGCGNKKREGYVNVDVCCDPDVRWDLPHFPWPFEDGSVDEVFSEHFLEHVQDYEKTILEIYRILKDDGVFHFKVPYFKSPAFPWHLHKYSFSRMTCKLLCERWPYMFGGKRLFEMDALRINFLPFLRPWLRTLFSKIANFIPDKWEYFGLPIDELEFVGRKVVE